MSSHGRCQDSLWQLFEVDCGYSGAEDGIAKRLGLTWEQWSQLIEPIIEAVYPIAYATGEEHAARRVERAAVPL